MKSSFQEPTFVKGRGEESVSLDVYPEFRAFAKGVRAYVAADSTMRVESPGSKCNVLKGVGRRTNLAVQQVLDYFDFELGVSIAGIGRATFHEMFPGVKAELDRNLEENGGIGQEQAIMMIEAALGEILAKINATGEREDVRGEVWGSIKKSLPVVMGEERIPLVSSEEYDGIAEG
jgi:hypothetical protein